MYFLLLWCLTSLLRKVKPVRIPYGSYPSVSDFDFDFVRSRTLLTELFQRDCICIVSQNPVEVILIASHLLPRRLGDNGVFQLFGYSVDRYRPSIGFLLNASIGRLVDIYQIGFLSLGNVSFLAHPAPPYTILPLIPVGSSISSVKTTLYITLSSHDPNLILLPDGVFDWHYV